MKAMTHSKAVEQDGLPVELSKLELQQDWTDVMELH